MKEYNVIKKDKNQLIVKAEYAHFLDGGTVLFVNQKWEYKFWLFPVLGAKKLVMALAPESWEKIEEVENEDLQ